MKPANPKIAQYLDPKNTAKIAEDLRVTLVDSAVREGKLLGIPKKTITDLTEELAIGAIGTAVPGTEKKRDVIIQHMPDGRVRIAGMAEDTHSTHTKTSYVVRKYSAGYADKSIAYGDHRSFEEASAIAACLSLGLYDDDTRPEFLVPSQVLKDKGVRLGLKDGDYVVQEIVSIVRIPRALTNDIPVPNNPNAFIRPC